MYRLKLLLLVILLPTSLSINSQVLSGENMLDPAFIESLSDEVGKELLTENDKKDQELEQLLRSETSLEKTKIILSRLRDQLNNIEARIEDPNLEDSDGLEIFGKSFFRTIQTTFSPINIPNPSGSYIVDVGDVFSITVVGSQDAELEVSVGRDGYLQIPQYGRIQVAGLEISMVEAKVQDFFTTKAIGSESYIQLKSLRDIQIILTGGIEYPGIYTISGGSNILSAINVGGGITDNGSFRSIQLIRNGVTLKEFDLYSLFINGKQTITNFQLRSGDVIKVKPVSFHVPVSGAVNENAIFEILQGETLQDVINFAGGFSQYFVGFDYTNLYRSGINGFNTQKISTLDLDKTSLKPRDSIIVPSFDNEKKRVKYVQILGRVKNPGKYIIYERDTLSALIKRAGGYEDDAYIYGGALFRQNAVNQEEFYSQLNYQDTVKFVIANIGKPYSRIDQNIIPLLQEELKSKSYTGRVVTEFDLNKISQEPSLDIVLQNEDKIIVPILDKVVYMFGDFKNPSNVTYDSNLTLKDYIHLAGGLRDSADESLVIINPDGTTAMYGAENTFLPFKKMPSIYPGTIIYAQRNIGKLDGIQFTSTLAPIISSLAISLASLNSITND